MDTTSIVRADTTISELVTAINKTHADCLQALGAGIDHARRIGELLHKAKRLCGHGNWSTWVETNCKFGERQARKYMKLHASWADITATQIGTGSSDLGINAALTLLSAKQADSPEPSPKRNWDHVPEDLLKAMTSWPAFFSFAGDDPDDPQFYVSVALDTTLPSEHAGKFWFVTVCEARGEYSVTTYTSQPACLIESRISTAIFQLLNPGKSGKASPFKKLDDWRPVSPDFTWVSPAHPFLQDMNDRPRSLRPVLFNDDRDYETRYRFEPVPLSEIKYVRWHGALPPDAVVTATELYHAVGKDTCPSLADWVDGFCFDLHFDSEFEVWHTIAKAWADFQTLHPAIALADPKRCVGILSCISTGGFENAATEPHALELMQSYFRVTR